MKRINGALIGGIIFGVLALAFLVFGIVGLIV